MSLPVLLFAGGAVWRPHMAPRQQQEAALVGFARDGAQLLDGEFDRVVNGLSVLAGSSALARGDLDGFATEMGSFLADSALSGSA